MDTITHVALGACLGELLAAKKIGKKALAFGALSQSVPDIDFILAFWLDPSANVLAHRGITHSFFFAMLITPILAWAAQRGWGSTQTTFKFWSIFFGVQIVVHSLLDGLNVYGTGWFEPFNHERVSFNVLFVADPFFSISLAIAALVLMTAPAENKKRTQWALAGIIGCLLYTGYCIMNKFQIDGTVRKALAKEQIVTDRYFTTPTPFNNWLWYVVANTDSGSYVGYRSVFDQESTINFQFFPHQNSLLAGVAKTKELDRLTQFSQGYYIVEARGDTLVFNDLRFGQMAGWQHPRAGFVFHYYLQPEIDNHLVLQRGRFANWDRSTTQSFIDRIRGVP